MHEVQQISVLRTVDPWDRMIEVSRSSVDVNGAVITITEDDSNGRIRIARVILNAEQVHGLFAQFFRN